MVLSKVACGLITGAIMYVYIWPTIGTGLLNKEVQVVGGWRLDSAG